MSAEQFETFKSKDGYTIEDTIGKSGLEATMESYLRGKCGEKRLEISKEGKLLNNCKNKIRMFFNGKTFFPTKIFIK